MSDEDVDTSHFNQGAFKAVNDVKTKKSGASLRALVNCRGLCEARSGKCQGAYCRVARGLLIFRSDLEVYKIVCDAMADGDTEPSSKLPFTCVSRSD